MHETLIPRLKQDIPEVYQHPSFLYSVSLLKRWVKKTGQSSSVAPWCCRFSPDYYIPEVKKGITHGSSGFMRQTQARCGSPATLGG